MEGRINMSIPYYQSIMLPLLKLVQDGKEHSLRGAADVLAEQFKLSPEEKNNYCQAAIKGFL